MPRIIPPALSPALGSVTYAARRDLLRFGSRDAITRFDGTKAIAQNAAAPLTIPVPSAYSDANNEINHPDVYYNPQGFGGHPYWMVATPYKASDSTFENPVLYYSDDGQTWTISPAGVLDATPSTGVNTRFNSDPDIAEAPDGTLWVTWRESGNSLAPIVYGRQSSDGVTWSAQTQIFQTDLSAENLASQSIFWDGNSWVMFYVDVLPATHKIKWRTAPAITGPWSASTDTGITAPTGKMLWHMDAIHVGGEIHLLLHCPTDGDSIHGGTLYVAVCKEPTRTVWTRAATPVLQSTAIGGWDYGVYRATFLLINEGNGLKYAIWYSALGTYWKIGYTEARVLPVDYPTEIWVPAERMLSSAGTPSLSTVAGGRVTAWLLDSASSEQVQCVAKVPAAWGRFTVDYWWTNVAAGAGNVSLGVKTSPVGDGALMYTGDVTATEDVYAAPLQDVGKVSTSATSFAAPASGYVNLRIIRRGANASDTLANDAGLLGVLLRPTNANP